MKAILYESESKSQENKVQDRREDRRHSNLHWLDTRLNQGTKSLLGELGGIGGHDIH